MELGGSTPLARPRLAGRVQAVAVINLGYARYMPTL